MAGLEEYLQECNLRLAKRTVQSYRRTLLDAERITGKELVDLTRADILSLAKTWRFRSQSLSSLRCYLAWQRPHTDLAGLVPEGRPTDSHRQLRWYTLAELELIVAACATPLERLMIHLAAELMLRRVEIERIRLEDFHATHISVLGKGRHGGKWRMIPYHGSTRVILTAYLSGHTQSRTSSGTLLNLRKSALDLRLNGIEQSLKWQGVNLHLEFHALRRTGARLYAETGFKMGKGFNCILELMTILGHTDPRTTMRYIGMDLEDAARTMAEMPSLETRLPEPSEPAPVPPMDRVGWVSKPTRTVPKTPPTS